MSFQRKLQPQRLLFLGPSSGQQASLGVLLGLETNASFLGKGTRFGHCMFNGRVSIANKYTTPSNFSCKGSNMQTITSQFVLCRAVALSFFHSGISCRVQKETNHNFPGEHSHTCHKPKSLKALCSRFAVHAKIHQEFMTHTHTHTIYDDMIICMRQALKLCIVKNNAEKCKPVQVYVALCRTQLSKDLGAEACGSQTWQRS